MKKISWLLSISSFLFATDYTERLTGALVSANGQNRTDNFIYQCNTRQCIFNYNSNFGLEYDGQNKGGILTAQGKKPANAPALTGASSSNTLFYLNGIKVQNGHLRVQGFSSTSSNLSDITLNNGIFEFESDKPYTGANNGTGIAAKGEISLTNAKLITNNLSSFGSAGSNGPNHSIKIDKDSTLHIKKGDIFNNYGSLDNKGMITFEGNTFVSLGNDQSKIGNASQIATLNNTGTIKVTGDFYNGGERSLGAGGRILCSIGGCGASNLTNEGIIEVGGNFYNKQGNHLKSSVELRGGVLKTSNFINESGNTLKFSANSAQEMGKLDGNLQNLGGVVAVDITGADFNKNYTFITGNVSGLTKNDLQVTSKGNPNDLVVWDLTSDGKGFALYPASVNPTLNTPNNPDPNIPNNAGGTTTKYDSLKVSLGSNKKMILDAIDSKIANFVTFGGSEYVTSVANDIETNVDNAFVATPKIAFDSLKASRSFKPVVKINTMKANATASILSDVFAIPIQTNSYEELDVSGFGFSIKGGDNSGYLAGVNFSYQKYFGEILGKIQANYAYTVSDYSLDNLQNKTKSSIFQLGGTGRYSFGPIETDVSAYFIGGSAKASQSYTQLSVLNATSRYNMYSIDGEIVIGPRLGERITFKPYIGFNHNYNVRTKINANGALSVGAKEDRYYALGGILGAEIQFNIENSGYLYSRLNHEKVLYYSDDKVLFDIAEQKNALIYTMDKTFKTSISLGLMHYYNQNIHLGIEGVYTLYSNNLQHLGGNVTFRYLF